MDNLKEERAGRVPLQARSVQRLPRRRAGDGVMEARDRLIVASIAGAAAAEAVVGEFGAGASFYKIGYQLVFSGGLSSPGIGRRRQKRLPRHEAARHRQHGGHGRRERRQARRQLPDRACLSADHAGGGRGR